MAKRPKTRGVILIHKTAVAETDFWGASFFAGEPVGLGLEVADRTLVSTTDRAARSFDSCVAKARELAVRMGYPDAEVRSPGAPAADVDPNDGLSGSFTPGR